MMILLLATLAGAPTQAAAVAPLHFGRFGDIAVYRPAGTPVATAVFFSGDGGWNQGVIDMASSMAHAGTLVFGVDTPRYLKAVDAAGDRCSYLAADAEALSQYGQKELQLTAYSPPLLIGYSSGAGLAYAALAQAPDNTFQGALSIGFDPELPTHTALCERNGLTSTVAARSGHQLLHPVSRLPAQWIVLQGEADQVWPADSAAAFVTAVAGAELVRLPRVGHGFSVQTNWMPQLKDALQKLAPRPVVAAAPADLGDLPVVDVPTPNPTADYFAIILSGDGGWASIDKQIGDEMAQAGVPVVGFNSLQYFWHQRSPDEIAADLERIIRHYQSALHRDKVVLIGYSRGADVLPLMASRLPGAMLDQVRLMAFLGIEHETNLEFRLGDWLAAQHQASYKLLPELQKLAGRPMLCLYGAKEGDTLCPDAPAGLMDVVKLEGGHHFDGDYRALARLIMEKVK
jgi:type IV secretory pathway VirJ component